MNYLLDEALHEFPHFITPLNDRRELEEMFYTYETQGNFYVNSV